MFRTLIVSLLLCSLTAHAVEYKGDAEKGKTLSATCSACHGSEGNNEKNIWPKLAGQHEAYLFKQLMAFKKGLRKNAVMAGMVAGLSQQDMADLSAYYHQLPHKGGTAQPKDLALGEQLYRYGDQDKHISACSACHGPDGFGNALARFPRLSGQNPRYITEQLHLFKTGVRCANESAMMCTIAQGMTERDMAALANYIAGLHE